MPTVAEKQWTRTLSGDPHTRLHVLHMNRTTTLAHQLTRGTLSFELCFFNLTIQKERLRANELLCARVRTLAHVRTSNRTDNETSTGTEGGLTRVTSPLTDSMVTPS